jgi:hypothetical protein
MRKTLILVVGCAFGIVLIIYLSRAFRPSLDPAGPAKQTVLLLAKAGGAEKVCEEASRLLNRFQGVDLKLFYGSELRDFPALTSLGNVDGIWSGPPAYIKIHVQDGHVHGFMINIINSNIADTGEFTNSTVLAEVVPGRIYVHR